MDHEPQADNTQNRWMRWALVAIASSFLLSERTTHVQRVLPYLLFAAGPLMHLFTPQDHGDHQQRHEQQSHPASEENQP